MRLLSVLLVACVTFSCEAYQTVVAAQERDVTPLSQSGVRGRPGSPISLARIGGTHQSLTDLLYGQFLPASSQAQKEDRGDGEAGDEHTGGKDEEATSASLPAPIHRCDRLAGSSNDPYAVVDGVAVADIDASEAVPACENAVRDFPDEVRFTFQLGRAFYAARQFDDAGHWFGRAARRGHAGAMSNLGTLHRVGRGVPQGSEEAFYWFSRAAHAGDPFGMANLASLYREGNGVTQDDVQATRWFRQAADLGVPFAMRMLGEAYTKGLGVAPDPREAGRWYRQAAQAGDVSAMIRLASAYANGVGLPEDEGEAARWYQAAADLGSTSAKYTFAQLLLGGRGVLQDVTKAAQLFLEAAEAGSVEAMFALGGLYSEGRGVDQDESIAVGWYRRSAEGGFTDAMTEYAFMLDRGQGVAADPQAAARWMYRAMHEGTASATQRIRSGEGSAALRDALRNRLEAEDYPPAAINWIFPPSRAVK